MTNEMNIRIRQPRINRTLFLTGIVDEYSTTYLMSMIDAINREQEEIDLVNSERIQAINKSVAVVLPDTKASNEMEKGSILLKLKTEPVEPIELHIMTSGGMVEEGLALANVIRTSAVPVYAFIHFAHSMGFIVASACDYRYGYPTTRMMTHDMGGYMSGTNEQMERTMIERNVLRELADMVIVENTGLTKEDLDEINKNVQDRYFTRDELLKYNLVDEILKYNKAEHIVTSEMKEAPEKDDKDEPDNN